MRRLALVPLLMGCAYYEDRISEIPRVIGIETTITIHADTRFTHEERAQIEAATNEWARFTGGARRFVILWDLDELTYLDAPLPVMHRFEVSPETGNAGGQTKDGVVRIVPDTCRARASVKACAMHEFGHLLGLEHFEAINGQVMSTCGPSSSRGCGPSGVFGVADRHECERVGVCRNRKLDVTTVTVTEDPSIPRIEPEYPQ